MLTRVAITFAATGNLTTWDHRPGLPDGPQEVVDAWPPTPTRLSYLSNLDPGTATTSMDPALYKQTMGLIRAKAAAPHRS